MRTLVLIAAVTVLTLAHQGHASAFCRRTTPIWTDANPVRIVIHPSMQDYIRHPFINPTTGLADDSFACTSSSQCGTDGLCATGYAVTPTSRCRGARWSRAELERAVQWVVGRINNETPADIPFAWVDLNDTTTCTITDSNCSDTIEPWTACFQSNTISILPSNLCNPSMTVSGVWNGSQWVYGDTVANRAMMIHLRWSDTNGVTYEHTGGHNANNFAAALLHELGHGLGLGHLENVYAAEYPTCVPNTIPPATTPLCVVGAGGTCPIMSSDQGEGLGLNQHFFGFDDIEGLVALYGRDSTPTTREFEDCDLGVAPSFTERTTTQLPLITDMAAAPGSSINTVFIGGRENSTAFEQRLPIWVWSQSTRTSTLATTVDMTSSFRSTGQIGVAASPTHVTVSSHSPRLTANARMWRRQIQSVRVPNAGGGNLLTTLNPAIGGPDDTAVPGVATVYHPGTSSWLHVFRDPNGQVLLAAWRTTSATWSLLPMGFRSFATPSITCSPNSCFIAFVEVPSPLAFGSTQTRLQWTEGTVSWPSGGSLAFTYTAGITTSYYNVLSDPVASVAQNPAGGWYYYVSTTWPQLSGGAWGTRVLTYRKSEGVTGTGALLQTTPLLAHSPGISEQPVAGGTGYCAELFTSRSP